MSVTSARYQCCVYAKLLSGLKGPRMLFRVKKCGWLELIVHHGAVLSLLIMVAAQYKLRFPPFNTLRPRQNEQHFADDIFKRILFNENLWISIKLSLKFVPKGPINNIPALVQIMAWRRPGDKPLSEPMMVSLLTHICVTRPQWVKAPTPEETIITNKEWLV